MPPAGWRLAKALGHIAEHGGITVDDAIDRLDLERFEASRRLGEWARWGKLTRIGRGVYGAPAGVEAV